MEELDLVAENPESTVVAHYESPEEREMGYQSEAQLEEAFIARLVAQGYERATVHNEAELIANLRVQLERLNNYTFTDGEWKRFFNQYLANANEGIEQKTRTIQEDSIKNFKRDTGETKNIYLIDKKDIHNNYLQVINQYAVEDGVRSNRYDVTVLVNGLPLVHIELKRRGVDIREAFNQINRYARESFWAGSGLFEYVQLFVISNGTHTKYYSNTTRAQHIKERDGKSSSGGKKTSHSFEFTSWWADAENRPIADLMDFARTFFARHTILNILTKYCVFTDEKMLLAMRPYQIVATERIINRINISQNYKTYGHIAAGGYIWHTTGSGKTLTSFKTAQLASQLPYIDKVLFVVDRKDLDYQTMREYDRFQKGAANSNTSTAVLQRQLEKSEARIIITTIQKLAIFISKNKKHDVYDKRVVIIFDECHRSQFGDMHTAIKKSFKKYNLFGFTGTPIFAVNASSSGKPNLKTTEQAFGDKLHTYTIVDAIADKNVLPFRIEYIATMREREEILDEQVWDIDREKALSAPERIANIVKYIREHFDQKTKRNNFYQLKEKRLNGFNSIFAVASINLARQYYAEFQKQMTDLPSDQRLKVALIYSFGVNEPEADGLLDDENSDSTTGLDKSSRDFLDGAIKDYNVMFGTNYDTFADKFQNYYKDVSKRVKEREIDLLIVVNMFLTGFDATTLNTLWVDKNLRLHGLLQAYSRTNRILNTIKTFGNIVCFRNLERATNESLALFGNRETRGTVILKTYDEYYNGYKDGEEDVRGYIDLIAELQSKYPSGEEIIGEEAKREFVNLYGAILKVRNILSIFDQFEGNELLSERDVQDYHSMYIDIYQELRGGHKADSENINDDIVFCMELIKQSEINIDYILDLIRAYYDTHLQDREIIVTIEKAVNSSVELRNKRELINQFISSLTPSSNVDEDWNRFVAEKRAEELERIILEEQLDKSKTKTFIERAFTDGYITDTGTDIADILPPVSPFANGNQYASKKVIIIERLKLFLERFYGI